MSRRLSVRVERGALAAFLSATSLLAALACSGDTRDDGAVVPSDTCVSGGAGCAASAPIGAGGSTSVLFPSETGAGGFILTEDYQPSSGGGAPSVCADLEVDFERVTPTVVLLIDRSGSMTERFDGGRNRWQTLVQTLTDPDSSLIKKLEGSVRFGMSLYTSNGGFGRNGNLTCPLLTNVEISLGNFSDISRALSRTANGPSGDTPTAESLEAIAAELAEFGEEGPKSIILATDGEPDTCEVPNPRDGYPNDMDDFRARSVAAVSAARTAGIATHIISVGDEISVGHLKALAVAGAGGDEDAEAYTALDTADLESAFEDIIGSVQTCDFTLQGRVEPGDAGRGSVLLDGESLEYDDPDGWLMLDESTVRLQGAACDAVQSNAARIAMSFPCDAIRIIPR